MVRRVFHVLSPSVAIASPLFPNQDPRITRLPCSHKGTYADDCICERVKQHRCYIVATCDRDLKRRIRKVGLGRGRLIDASAVFLGGVPETTPTPHPPT